MKKRVSLVCLAAIFFLAITQIDAQVGINTDNSAPAPSAGLDVKFGNKGVLIPRLTVSDRNAIASPAEGLMVFCTDCGSDGSLSIFSNGSWHTFSPCTVPSPSATLNTITPGQVTWRWNAAPGATGYKWSTSTNYTLATDVGAALYYAESGITCGSSNTRHVWSYNTCGLSEMTVLTQAISAAAPATPASAAHVSTKTTILWKWHPVPDATGYKWGPTNDFAMATDLGTDTTKAEAGLACNTSYTRYAWAYNGCGHSQPIALEQSTNLCFVCGDSITVYHVADSVAPLTVTITYGTVDSIWGEFSKCWISRNLGALRQAASRWDQSGASAGWYWQFDSKQGYHWIMFNLTEPPWPTAYTAFDQHWQAANDPCTIELGSAWRIPTYTEWQNVLQAYGWFGIILWDTELKMHNAGYLNPSNGTLLQSGGQGYYWTSTQSNQTIGSILLLDNFGNGTLDGYYKSGGLPLRCLRE